MTRRATVKTTYATKRKPRATIILLNGAVAFICVAETHVRRGNACASRKRMCVAETHVRRGNAHGKNLIQMDTEVHHYFKHDTMKTFKRLAGSSPEERDYIFFTRVIREEGLTRLLASVDHRSLKAEFLRTGSDWIKTLKWILWQSPLSKKRKRDATIRPTNPKRGRIEQRTEYEEATKLALDHIDEFTPLVGEYVSQPEALEGLARHLKRYLDQNGGDQSAALDQLRPCRPRCKRRMPRREPHEPHALPLGGTACARKGGIRRRTSAVSFAWSPYQATSRAGICPADTSFTRSASRNP